MGTGQRAALQVGTRDGVVGRWQSPFLALWGASQFPTFLLGNVRYQPE